MPEKIRCTNSACGRHFQVSSDLAKDNAECPACGKLVNLADGRNEKSSSTRKFGEYRAGRKILQSDAGALYHAVEETTGRQVVLNVLLPDRTKDSGLLAEFQQRVKAASELHHPGIVRILGAGVHEGLHYFVMERIKGGESLRQKMDREGHLDWQEALRYARQLAAALRYAWTEKKLAHLHLQPECVLISGACQAKLTHFGMPVTASGAFADGDQSIRGSLPFLSPEQGLGDGPLDFRSDIYSLGILLFTMMAGCPPFQQEKPSEILDAHKNQPLPDISSTVPEAPAPAGVLLHRMCAKHVADRFQDYGSLVDELDTLCSASPPPSASPPTPSKSSRFFPTTTLKENGRERKRLLRPLILTGVFLLTAVLIGQYHWKGRYLPGTSLSSPGNSSPSRTEASTDSAATIDPSERAHWKGKQVYHDALRFLEEHPEEYDEARAKLGQVVEISGRGRYGQLARKEIRRLDSRRDAEVQAAWKKFRDRIAGLEKEGKFKAAMEQISTLEGFPRGLAKHVDNEMLEPVLRELEKEAFEKSEAFLKQAETAQKNGELERARECFQKAEACGVASHQETIATGLAAVKRALVKAEAQTAEKRRAASEALYSREEKKILWLAESRQYETAIRHCEDLISNPRLADLRQRFAMLKSDLDKAKKFYLAALNGWRPFKGRRFQVRGMKGKLQAVQDGRFIIRASGVETSLRFEELPPEILVALSARTMKNLGPEGNLCLALFWIFEKQWDQASKAIETARSQGQDVSVYEKRFAPRLVISSRPPGAQILLESEGKRESLDIRTPASVSAGKERAYIVWAGKVGYQSASIRVETGVLGRTPVRLRLKPLEIPSGRASGFRIPLGTVDAFGNPIRRGVDAGTGLPLEIEHARTGMQFVFIPAGEFVMGDKKGAGAERPPHRVSITRPFYMGKYEVTVSQFRVFARNAPYRTSAETRGYGAVWDGKRWSRAPVNWQDPGFEQTGRHPAAFISLDDARACVQWFNGSEEGPCQIPTEAQWEYACRAGSPARFFWGDASEPAARYANAADLRFRKAHANWYQYFFEVDDGYATTAPAGSYKPNAFGLYDMIGNVREWCRDYYGDHFYADSPAKDPFNAEKSEYFAVRGGSWFNSPRASASYHRFWSGPDSATWDKGFRLMLELSDWLKEHD